MKETNSIEHAIVIGGGFAGLLASRVLANFFKKITLIERDSMNDVEVSTQRKGVPQSFHFHILQAQGAEILRKFFPDIETTLVNNGAFKLDTTEEIRICAYGQKPNYKSEKYTYAQSRTLLEKSIRSLLKIIPLSLLFMTLK